MRVGRVSQRGERGVSTARARGAAHARGWVDGLARTSASRCAQEQRGRGETGVKIHAESWQDAARHRRGRGAHQKDGPRAHGLALRRQWRS